MTRKMILELDGESLTWRDVLPSLLEHLPDVRRKRHEAQQMLAEEPLALISARPGEHAPAAVSLMRPSLSSANARRCKAVASGSNSPVDNPSLRARAARLPSPRSVGEVRRSRNPISRLMAACGSGCSRPPCRCRGAPSDSLRREVSVE